MSNMIVKECKNAELDAKNKTALYLDDFDSFETWQGICKRFNIPTNADQIYFDAENITYC
tara:strand:- start:21 stop:200 length:180 start_codon:yes stop_codon:yes gene_type:complete